MREADYALGFGPISQMEAMLILSQVPERYLSITW